MRAERQLSGRTDRGGISRPDQTAIQAERRLNPGLSGQSPRFRRAICGESTGGAILELGGHEGRLDGFLAEYEIGYKGNLLKDLNPYIPRRETIFPGAKPSR